MSPPEPPEPRDYDDLRQAAAGLVASGRSLVDLDEATSSDPPLRRLVRHLWIERERRPGETNYGLAKRIGLSRRVVERWSTAPEACTCRRLRSADARFCDRCAREHRRRWSREALLSARDHFVAEHGRLPMSTDWHPSRNPRMANSWPPASAVTKRFGSWALFRSAEH